MDAIKTDKLMWSFGSCVAVDSLTRSVPQEVVFSFLGPNAAGTVRDFIKDLRSEGRQFF